MLSWGDQIGAAVFYGSIDCFAGYGENYLVFTSTAVQLFFLTWILFCSYLPCAQNVKRVNAAKRTYVNFSKANWVSFREYLEEDMGRLPEPQYIHIGKKHFRK